MHPAGSVIIFTVASGLGFGLLTWLGLGLPNTVGWAAFWHYAVGFSLAGGCLLYTSPSPRDVEESRMPSSA